MNTPKVLAITATSGRHLCLERSVRFFLDQDYDNCVQLIYQNSKVEQRLNSNLSPTKIILINQCRNSITHEDYNNLGQIYNDIIKYIPEDIDVIVFWDDDDVFLPNHISEGVSGLIRGNKTAYKPAKSMYKHGNKISMVSNTLEPSIFVKSEHIRKYRFSDTTSDQHMSWVQPLVYNNEIFVDQNGPATYVCDWSQEIPTFKTSGNPGNPENFKNYRNFSADHGDGIVTPLSKNVAQAYYSQFDKFRKVNDSK